MTMFMLTVCCVIAVYIGYLLLGTAKAEVKKEGLKLASEAVKIAAEATVGKLEEIASKEIRKKIKNGEAGMPDLYAVANEAYDEIVATISPKLLELLGESVENTELYIRNQIETQLLLLKAKLKEGNRR